MLVTIAVVRVVVADVTVVEARSTVVVEYEVDVE